MRRTMMLLAALTLGSACGERYHDVDLRKTAGAQEAEVSGVGLAVPQGRAVAFDVAAQAEGNHRDYDATDEIELRSTNEGVARIEPGVQVDSWILWGVATGEAEIEILINDELVDAVPVEVGPS